MKKDLVSLQLLSIYSFVNFRVIVQGPSSTEACLIILGSRIHDKRICPHACQYLLDFMLIKSTKKLYRGISHNQKKYLLRFINTGSAKTFLGNDIFIIAAIFLMVPKFIRFLGFVATNASIHV